MRQIQLLVPEPRVAEVLELAREHDARGPISDAREAQGNGRVLLINLPNDRVGQMIEAVGDRLGEAKFTLLPVGSLPLDDPWKAIENEVRDVSRLSSLELVLSALQSLGSWRGLVLYSVFAAFVGAYGIIFDITYLLVGAMLINPMGAPAMVAVVGLAIGDARIFARGGGRFFASIAIQAGTALLLAFAYRLQFSTEMMEQVTNLSWLAAVLALVAGAAGAQAQVQSDRDSLVSSTASGFMVAAALAPPAAVLGLAIPLARWDYVALMAFLLAVQFVAISLGGWLVLLLAFGVGPESTLVERGSLRVRTLLASGVTVAVALAMIWQLQLGPGFRKADLTRAAIEATREVVERTSGIALIEANARFTRPELDRYEREGLLVELFVEDTGEGPGEEALREAIRARLLADMPDVVPFVHVTILP